MQFDPFWILVVLYGTMFIFNIICGVMGAGGGSDTPGDWRSR